MVAATKLTPVLFVDAIEPCLPFWCDRLGFARTVEVPHGERLGFVILSGAGAELMLQTWESLADDLPGIASRGSGDSVSLFVEVEELHRVIEALRGTEVLTGPRDTWYGTREIVVRDPAGVVVVLAERTGVEAA